MPLFAVRYNFKDISEHGMDHGYLIFDCGREYVPGVLKQLTLTSWYTISPLEHRLQRMPSQPSPKKSLAQKLVEWHSDMAYLEWGEDLDLTAERTPLEQMRLDAIAAVMKTPIARVNVGHDGLWVALDNEGECLVFEKPRRV